MTGRSWQGLHAARRAIGGATAAVLLLLSGTAGLQDANANGDTRTLHLYHEHTKESLSVTFRHGGRYVGDGLRQLNWFLRDWRIDEQVAMDPKLFDIVWQVYREARATGPIHVNSAYRSPQTNAALRRRSRAVAEYSQHMRGKALDFFLEGVSMARVREIGMKLQHGGVGFYPHSRHQFVHLDAGGVRSWPRMPDAQLARLFPDGRTVHIPSSGQPLSGYEAARASILARGGAVAGTSTYAEGGRRKSLWATLFGGGEDEAEDMGTVGGGSQMASAGMNDSDGGARNFFSFFGGGSSNAAPAAPTAAQVEPELPPAATASVSVPASAPAPVPTAITGTSIAIPLPPRRPVELASMRDAPAKEGPGKFAVTAPPSRPPSSRQDRGPGARVQTRSPNAPIGHGDKAALRSLFNETGTAKPASKTRNSPAADSKIRTSLSSSKQDVSKTGSLNRPKVARLPAKR